MTEYIKTFGLVIKQNDVGEADRSLTVLTEDCGKINVWVNGARRSRSRHVASSQLFCASHFVLFKGRGIYRINSSEVVEPFFNLRTDIDKLNYAAYLVELTNDGVQEGFEERSGDILKLLLNSLHFIANTEKHPELIVHIFEIRFMSLIGFAPLIHEKHIETAGGSISLSEGGLNAIKHILAAPPEKLFSFNLSQEVLNELRVFCKTHVEQSMGKEYKKMSL